MPQNPYKTNTYAPYREEWLRLHVEDILEPELLIIDPHHHIWDEPRPKYMMEQLMADLISGHNIVATVFVECRSHYYDCGPVEFRPTGEVAFVSNLAATSIHGPFGPIRACDKIVGHVDLELGDGVGPVLDRMVEIGSGRLAGIRHASASDPDPEVISPAFAKPPGLLLSSHFRAGFKRLVSMGLSFDAYLYHTQLTELADLARTFPDANIILDHLGSPIGIGSYATRREDVYATWLASMAILAQYPNISVKLGGLGMKLAGFTFHQQAVPPTSIQLANAWQRYIETCIDLFGPERCMFESNFPPDKGTCSYIVLWNTFKRLTKNYSETDRKALFCATAARVYGITI